MSGVEYETNPMTRRRYNEVNTMERITECRQNEVEGQLDLERFLRCTSFVCVEKEKRWVEERASLGDPNAQFTLSFL